MVKIKTGARTDPNRTMVIGVEGVGKSTFGANAPAPIFICAEDGLPRGLDIPRFDSIETLSDVIDSIDFLRTEAHEFKTLVIDSVDWVEPLIIRKVCADNNWTNIEQPGYGKGWIPVTETWRALLARLDALRHERGMEVVLLAHAATRLFQSPTGDDYTRYECKLQRSGAALLVEWVDDCMFAQHETVVVKPENKNAKSKGFATGARVLYTAHGAGWTAKSRSNLPATLPLSWEAYEQARSGKYSRPVEELRGEIKTLADRMLGSGILTEEKKNEIIAYSDTTVDVVQLVAMLDRMNVKIDNGN